MRKAIQNTRQERTQAHQPRRAPRRQGTRAGILAAAMREV